MLIKFAAVSDNLNDQPTMKINIERYLDSATSIQTATVTRKEQLGNSIYDEINYQLDAVLGLALTYQSAKSTSCNVTERPRLCGK